MPSLARERAKFKGKDGKAMTRKRTHAGQVAPSANSEQVLVEFAAEIAREKAQTLASIEALSLDEARRSIHQLQVHQIELERQNDELRGTQAELRASQARYADLYDLAPVGYLSLSEQGLVVQANLTATTLLGVARDELVKQPFTRFILKEHQDTYDSYRRLVSKTGMLQVCELQMVRVDGTVFWGSLATNPKQYGEGSPMRCIVLQDITDRKRAEEVLRESEDRFRYVFDHCPIGKSITRPSGEVDVNIAFCRMLGYSKEDLQGLKWQDISHPDDLQTTQKAVDRVISGEQESTRFTKRYIRKDGSVLWADECTALRRNERGEPVYFVTAVSDISEQKYAEAQIRQYQIRLKSLSSQLTIADERFKRDTAARVHDTISQSLAMLKLKVGVLIQSVDDDRITAALEEISDRVGEAIEQAQSLTFALSYPALKVLGFEKAVAKWLAEEVEARHGIATTFNSYGKGSLLDEDTKAVLFRGVRELFANVVKHAGASRVDVFVRNDADCLAVTVKDDGRGFDPRQIGGATGGGFGILSIEEALEGVGGGLTIDSKPGQGCTATLSVPLNAEAGQLEGRTL